LGVRSLGGYGLGVRKLGVYVLGVKGLISVRVRIRLGVRG